MASFRLIDDDGFALTDADGFAVDHQCPQCCGEDDCVEVWPFLECHPPADGVCEGLDPQTLYLCDNARATTGEPVSALTIIKVDGYCFTRQSPSIPVASFAGDLYTGPFDATTGDCSDSENCPTPEVARYIVGVKCPLYGPDPDPQPYIIRDCLVRGCVVLSCHIFTPGIGKTLAEIGSPYTIAAVVPVGGDSPGEGDIWKRKCCCGLCYDAGFEWYPGPTCDTELVQCCRTGTGFATINAELEQTEYNAGGTVVSSLKYTWEGNSATGIDLTIESSGSGTTVYTGLPYAGASSGLPAGGSLPGWAYPPVPSGVGYADIQTYANNGRGCLPPPGFGTGYTVDIAYSMTCSQYTASGVNLFEQDNTGIGGTRVVIRYQITITVVYELCSGGCGGGGTTGSPLLAGGYW